MAVHLGYEVIADEDKPVPCGIGKCTNEATHYVRRSGGTVVADTCRRHTREQHWEETRQGVSHG